MTGARHLVLVGMMGAGKSSVARRLAAGGLVLLDTDTLVEERTGRSVREIFSTDGEPAFRRIEEAVVADCLDRTEPSVIAAAGGATESSSTRDLLCRARSDGRAFVVWLRADPGELAQRVGRSSHRPLLDGDAAGRLRELSAARSAHYGAVADLVIDTDAMSVAEVADTVRAAFSRAAREGMDGRVDPHG